MSTQPDPYTAPARRFSSGDLARLMEIASAVKCECPNQISRLMTSLQGFEDYSRDCQSTSPEDAEIHTMLYRKTAEARVILEGALVELMAFENIVLD